MDNEKDKVTCNGCGYAGPDWEGAESPYSWGRCPKCGTTNLAVETWCTVCGTKQIEVFNGLQRCPKCHPEPVF
jgi:Zn finger protein HypA/HybF involved in hydrogenase expression